MRNVVFMLGHTGVCLDIPKEFPALTGSCDRNIEERGHWGESLDSCSVRDWRVPGPSFPARRPARGARAAPVRQPSDRTPHCRFAETEETGRRPACHRRAQDGRWPAFFFSIWGLTVDMKGASEMFVTLQDRFLSFRRRAMGLVTG